MALIISNTTQWYIHVLAVHLYPSLCSVDLWSLSGATAEARQRGQRAIARSRAYGGAKDICLQVFVAENTPVVCSLKHPLVIHPRPTARKASTSAAPPRFSESALRRLACRVCTHSASIVDDILSLQRVTPNTAKRGPRFAVKPSKRANLNE